MHSVPVSYDIENDKTFPAISNKRTTNNTITITNSTDCTNNTTSITNEESTIASFFTQEDFVKMLENKIKCYVTKWKHIFQRI